MREFGEIRLQFAGDKKAAQGYIGVARTQLGILKNLMSFSQLKQLSRTVTLDDGTQIKVSSVFGQDAVTINVPPVTTSPNEPVISGTVKGTKVVDYVGVTMPNPVPYRSLIYGFVDKGLPYIQIQGYMTYNLYHANGILYRTIESTYDGVMTSYGGGGYVVAGSASDRIIDNGVVGDLWRGWTGDLGYGYSNGFSQYYPGMRADGQPGAGSFSSFGYESLATSDVNSGIAGRKFYVTLSSGENLFSKQMDYLNVGYSGGYFVPSYEFDTWRGSDSIYASYIHVSAGSIINTTETFNFTIPEDVIYPEPIDVFDFTQKNPYIESYPFGYGNITSTFYSLGASVINGVLEYTRVKSTYSYDMSEFVPTGEVVNIGASKEAALARLRVDQISALISDDPVFFSENPPSRVYQWYANVAQGLIDFTARRKAWNKKNSDEFIAALKGNFSPNSMGVTHAQLKTGKLPPEWERIIKNSVQDSTLTYQPIQLNVTMLPDTIVRDTLSNGFGSTHSGSRKRERIVIFEYVDSEGEKHSEKIIGYETVTVTAHSNYKGLFIIESVDQTYVDWYEPSYQYAYEKVLLNGTIQSGAMPDSAIGYPYNPLDYRGLNPPYPNQSDNITYTKPKIVIDYHRAILPKYEPIKNYSNKKDNPEWNNSKMFGVKKIELLIFSPYKNMESLGIFANPADADGATQIAYYGEASFSFDWFTGDLKWLGWMPRKDVNGNVEPTIVSLPEECYYSEGRIIFSASNYFLQSALYTLVELGLNKESIVIAAENAASDAYQLCYSIIRSGVLETPFTKHICAEIKISVKSSILNYKKELTEKNYRQVLNKNIMKSLKLAIPMAVYSGFNASLMTDAEVRIGRTPEMMISMLKINLFESCEFNLLIGYVWDKPSDLWPDVANLLRNKIKGMVEGSSNQALYTIIKQAIKQN